MRSVWSILSFLLTVYSLMFWARIILSWLNTPSLGPVAGFIAKTTDPVLNFFRNLRKNKSGSMFDYSYLCVFMIIGILRSVLSVLSINGTITVWYILAIIINEVWSYIRFIFIFLLVILLIRVIMGMVNSVNSQVWIQRLDRIVRAAVNFVYRILSPLYRFFLKNAEPTAQTEAVCSFIFFLVIFICLSVGVSALCTFLIGL